MSSKNIFDQFMNIFDLAKTSGRLVVHPDLVGTFSIFKDLSLPVSRLNTLSNHFHFEPTVVIRLHTTFG